MAHEWSHGTFYWNELMTRDAEKAKKLTKLIDALEDNDDVQSVSHNAEIPDDVAV